MASELDKLIKRLRDPDPAVRKQIVRDLGRIGHPDAAKALVASLRDADWFVRLEAVRMLAARRDPQAAEPLKDLYFQVTNDSDNPDIPLGFHEFVLAALKNLGWEMTYGGFTRKGW